MAEPILSSNGLLAAVSIALLAAGCGDREAPATVDHAGVQAEASSDDGSASLPARTSPDMSEQTPGALPLAAGVYVASGETCASPANAGFRIYNGQGLSGSATRECRAIVRSRDGDLYQVNQSCIDTYSSQRASASQTIRIETPNSFTLTEGGEPPVSFRLCPAGEAPPYLQDLAAPA